MVPFFKVLFTNTIATESERSTSVYVETGMHHPTYKHAVLALYFFILLLLLSFPIVFLYLKMKPLTTETIVVDQSQTEPTDVFHLLAKDCFY